MKLRTLSWSLVLGCALCSAGWAQKSKRPEKVDVHLYGKAATGVAVTHRLVKGTYSVRFTLTGLLADPYPRDRKAWKPPVQKLSCAAPEAGVFGKPKLKGSLMVKLGSAAGGNGPLVITLTHTKYMPPVPRELETASLTPAELTKTSDAIISGMFGARASRVRGVLRGQIRGKTRFARSVLHALCLAYHVPEEAAKKQPLPVWRYVAKLTDASDRGDRDRVFEAVRAAVAGYSVEGAFTPDARVLASATRVRVRGDVGKAILVGRVGGKANPNDWWRVELGDEDDPITAEGETTGLVWVRVTDPAFEKGCYLRVFSAAAEPVPYRLKVINKSGPQHQWTEVHEAPAPDEELPQ